MLADQAHAKIYIRESRLAPLVLQLDLSHPPAQKKQNDMGVDRPGRVQESMNSQRHSYDDHGSFPEQESRVFLQKIANVIDEGTQSGELDSLVLVALPKTREFLKSSLGKLSLEKCTAEYSKNLVSIAAHSLSDRLDSLKEAQKEKQK